MPILKIQKRSGVRVEAEWVTVEHGLQTISRPYVLVRMDGCAAEEGSTALKVGSTGRELEGGRSRVPVTDNVDDVD